MQHRPEHQLLKAEGAIYKLLGLEPYWIHRLDKHMLSYKTTSTTTLSFTYSSKLPFALEGMDTYSIYLYVRGFYQCYQVCGEKVLHCSLCEMILRCFRQLLQSFPEIKH